MADRKDNKRRKIRLPALIGIAAVVCAVAAGVTLAYMFKRTGNVTNNIEAAKVTCEVKETYKDNVKSSIAVTNTSNVPVYVRVKLVSYWQDTDGNVVGKPSPELNVSVNTDGGWCVSGAGSDTFYYCSQPVAAGADTESLLSDSLVLSSDTWCDAGGKTIEVHQVVEVFAEAIQSEPASAVTEAWGVTMDSGE